jgi:hypothetical protein
MSNSAKYIRIFNASPDDEYVNKRTAAIKAITDKFKKLKTIDELMGLCEDLCRAFLNEEKLPDNLVEIVGKALSDQSSSFVVEEQGLQVATCSLIAVLDYLSKTSISGPLSVTVTDVIAASLLSGMSFMTPDFARPKLDELRQEIVKESGRICGDSSIIARDRLAIKELTTITEGGDFASNNKNLISAISPLIKALTTNAVLDREEINILWYMLDDTSEILKSKFEELNVGQAAIVRGIEISTLLRRLPTSAHFLIAQRSLPTVGEYNTSELKAELGEKLVPITDFLSDYPAIKKYPNIFPLFSSLLDEDARFLGAEIKRSLQSWTNIALLEGSLLNISKYLNDGK